MRCVLRLTVAVRSLCWFTGRTASMAAPSVHRARSRQGGHKPTRLLACVAIATAAWQTTQTFAASIPAVEPVVLGRVLFEKQWQEFDAGSYTGDGLGPMFNARSCVACHNQGGVGGSGSKANNVELLCLVPTSQITRIDRRSFVAVVARVHSGFVVNATTALPTITFHKSSTHPAYANLRGAIVARLDRKSGSKGWMRLRRFERRTPSLFGAGLIDAIPPNVLRETARLQAQSGGANGQVPPASDGSVGKFGWRGQTSSLERFVQGACANELGLHVPSASQPRDPLDMSATDPGLDLNEQQCAALTAFVASLPAPAQRVPHDETARQSVASGQRTFERIGCAACHPAQLGPVRGMYSDLLLHDMGPELADPAGPNLPGQTGMTSMRDATKYYGGTTDVFVAVPPESQRMWRTPPLWDLDGSGPYLHDGRARTLDQAIRAHGGDARGARSKYAALSSTKRLELLIYLYGLGVPPGAPRVAANLE